MKLGLKLLSAVIVPGVIVLGCRAAAAETQNAGSGTNPPNPANPQDLVNGYIKSQIVAEPLAGDLLGRDDLSVIQPGTLAGMAAQLENIMKGGVPQNGISLEVSPIGMGLIRFKDYPSSIIGRSSFSFAGTQDASQSHRIAIGWRYRILDTTDWRLSPDLQDALRKDMREVTQDTTKALGRDLQLELDPNTGNPLQGDQLTQVQSQNTEWLSA